LHVVKTDIEPELFLWKRNTVKINRTSENRSTF